MLKCLFDLTRLRVIEITGRCVINICNPCAIGASSICTHFVAHIIASMRHTTFALLRN